MRLLITRPEPDATRTAEALAALGHEALVSPSLAVTLLPDVPLPRGRFQALIATSANALRALASHHERAMVLDLPIFTVGDQSTRQAQEAGFANAVSAEGAVDELVAMVSSRLKPEGGPILYLAGETQAGDPAGQLEAAGFAVQTWVLYQTEPVVRLSPEATLALRSGHIDGVLLYSRKSATAFALALRGGRLSPLPENTAIYCISEAAAEPVRRHARGPVLVAERPDGAHLFALLTAPEG
ncbi:uroporphyrinogen-III synthase [Faunimonas pinastri]|uniref:Uroporphyrinogen-III synthase n=1 Tax=Faunimonas pinastri TaxID=1855383 RepID=A0A1H9IR18_9HYPH|nr:uroporphyrinogen-III synthase [Faunimonas pinastri]SEQ76942.1 uroporphyrinogen-III synthase [Faunimonas pinastri]